MQQSGHSAYCYGYGAAMRGEAYTANPHPAGTAQHDSWAAGFRAEYGNRNIPAVMRRIGQ